MGRTAGAGGSRRWAVLGCLTDAEWRTTKEIAARVGIERANAYGHLCRLEMVGMALHRRGAGRELEWCWMPEDGPCVLYSDTPATAAQ